MGAPKKTTNQSRRDFFSVFKKKQEDELVKMLTPDGKLVTVPKSVLTKAENRKKVNNQDILNWMNNPSIEK
jgi:hypothetical protein